MGFREGLTFLDVPDHRRHVLLAVVCGVLAQRFSLLLRERSSVLLHAVGHLLV